MSAERPLNILVFAPQSTALVNGGVRRQMLETVEGLRALGQRVEIASPDGFEKPQDYDVVHLFAASPESLATARILKASAAPLVVSPVLFISRSARSVRNTLRVLDRLGALGVPIRTELQMKRDVCKLADLLAPNTSAEAELIAGGFGVPQNRMRIVPNGVDADRFAQATPDLFHSLHPWRSFILFVGDAGAPRKNVRSLVRAYGEWRSRFPATAPDLIIAGSIGDDGYGKELKTSITAQEGARWIGPVDHKDPLLASLYRAARVFVLPSQFETPGIAAMEAALAGCRIAITRHGGTREVFGGQASYLEPADPASIAAALQSAWDAPDPQALRDRLAARCDWSRVAKQTLEAYRRILADGPSDSGLAS